MKKNGKLKNLINFLIVILLVVLTFANIKLYLQKNEREKVFGVKFGDSVASLNIINTHKYKNGSAYHEIIPSRPLDDKSYKYIVKTTSGNKNQVYEIMAKKSLKPEYSYDETKKYCEKERAELAKTIRGNFEFYFDRDENIMYFFSKNKVIYLACDDIENNIIISYIDRSIYNSDSIKKL